MRALFIRFLFIAATFSECVFARSVDYRHLDFPQAEDFPKQTIVLATHIEPPLIYFNGDTLTGPNIEVARLLAKRFDLNIEFLYCPFARCLNLLENGSADFIVGIHKRNERKEYLSYLNQPYSSRTTALRFYLRKNSEHDIQYYEDLKTLNIGVLRGAAYFERFDNETSLKKTEVTTHQQLLEMLVKERFDTFLGREVSFRSYVSEEFFEKEIKLSSYIVNKKADSYIAISNKSSFLPLKDSFSQYLNEAISNGEIVKIMQKHLDPDQLLQITAASAELPGNSK